jgi:hypothetical protein
MVKDQCIAIELTGGEYLGISDEVHKKFVHQFTAFGKIAPYNLVSVLDVIVKNDAIPAGPQPEVTVKWMFQFENVATSI